MSTYSASTPHPEDKGKLLFMYSTIDYGTAYLFVRDGRVMVRQKTGGCHKAISEVSPIKLMQWAEQGIMFAVQS